MYRCDCLHFYIIYSSLSIIYIHIQTHTLCVIVLFNCLLQFRIFHMINIQLRKNSLQQFLTQLRILHNFSKQEVIGYA